MRRCVVTRCQPESKSRGLKDRLLHNGVGVEVLSDGTNSKRYIYDPTNLQDTDGRCHRPLYLFGRV
ncbi:protein of unknown function (plasmid) [Cupriavidus taiwanensis]|uniref:Uncharacterized protein n=1 Tax=Cupriavidus taiwanensis TaxID=164546 RepID=A0A375FJP2_9BURK|nr:protein of unknown function [Cupriavidus taiwanensis]SOZ72442.1 protein of unknown function [Cupriavidus taiwanensis]SOZ74839.1 protein of unknown function [Cupriavidus taiwanensis]SPA03645.1 protein of unknown function [Cupriavidus taiwanensis]SPA11542.1 protein of unknown function [Cupriavidus taiwanensis]